MAKEPKKQSNTKNETSELERRIEELTADLQRVRADFENYRKRVEQEKANAGSMGEMKSIMKLLPVIDTLERAIAHAPADLAKNPWVQGVVGLRKQLEKSLAAMQVTRIEATPGTSFDPELHQAVQFDEDAAGEHEVIDEELQAGYLLNGTPLRHAMVKVTRR